ncbi:MAG: mannose-1-phosphate guanylyltransferase/mannose-6-phosphate isomerase, partial [Planktomarina sp.]
MAEVSNSNKVFPVVLTGGAGTRLWPVSRKSFPKQFQPIGNATGEGAGENNATLFQNTLARVQGQGFAAPLIVTAEPFRFIVQEQMHTIGQVPHAMLVEPEGRNTAPAVLAAALHLIADHPDAVMLVLPSDHVIADVDVFQAMVAAAVPAAQTGEIVTFGVTPTRAETGYGYLELSAPVAGDNPVPLRRFVEKPDVIRAETFVHSGRHLWNAGIFLARCDTWVAAYQTHARDMIAPVQAALDGAVMDLGYARLAPTPWAGVADISVDYAIMERAENISVQPLDAAWSDLGSWDAVWRDAPQDGCNVAMVGAGAHAIDCDNTLIYHHEDGPAVVGLGLSDMVVVATGDAVLVADKDRIQDVKLAVDQLTCAGQRAADQTPRFHRPWGWYETLALGGRFQVKRIVVKPGGCLSLQSHHHRSEHWVVVEGTARVTVNDEVT